MKTRYARIWEIAYLAFKKETFASMITVVTLTLLSELLKHINCSHDCNEEKTLNENRTMF